MVFHCPACIEIVSSPFISTRIFYKHKHEYVSSRLWRSCLSSFVGEEDKMLFSLFLPSSHILPACVERRRPAAFLRCGRYLKTRRDISSNQHSRLPVYNGEQVKLLCVVYSQTDFSLMHRERKLCFIIWNILMFHQFLLFYSLYIQSKFYTSMWS